LAQEDDPARKEARQGMNMVYQVSAEVLSLLCAALSDPARSLAARRAVADALIKILKNNANQRSDTAIHAALTTVLDDTDTDIRRSAAYALQWTTGQGAWSVAQALLRAAQADTDSETHALSLRSAGRVLHAVRVRDVDVSKEASFRWLED
jgi:hypothetical protein